MPKKHKKRVKVKKWRKIRGKRIDRGKKQRIKLGIRNKRFKVFKDKPLKKVKRFDKKQVELLRKIVDSIAGQNASDIVNILYGRENVNEFIIAKKLGITINQARNILYRLGDEGLVSFIRKKDKKNGGWYTYFWTLDIRKSLVALQKKMLNEIENLENQLKSKKTKRFYYCPNCEMEMSEENALLHDFTCPECGEVFELKDNLEVIESLERDTQELKHDLLFVEDEILVIEKREEAVKIRRLKAEEKKKKAEREVKRKARARLKKRLMKKEGLKGKEKVKKKKKKATSFSRRKPSRSSKDYNRSPKRKKKFRKKKIRVRKLFRRIVRKRKGR